VDGKIFAIGGGIVETASTAANEVYNPATDTWITESPMQQKRYGLVVASVGNKIYAIGGTVPPMLSTVEEYDTGLGIPSPDFNGDEIVDIEDLLILIEHWGQNEPSVDIAPPPFGDGIIDVQDLEDLIAHWKLDETEGTVVSDSASEHDGTVIGVPAWQPAGGIVDGAMEFDGTTFVVTDPVLSPSEGPFSVFAWVRGGAPGQVILSQQGGADWLTLDLATGALKTELKSSGRFAHTLTSQAVITDGNWHRVGFTWDGANRRLYVDDMLVVEDTDTGLAGGSGGMNIGCGKVMAPGSFWSGLIDDMRIYNREVQP
jgi:hypothetical protein